MIKKRKSNRLAKWDYASSGYYFVTICTQNNDYIFGEIIDGKMILNDAGRMIDLWWQGIFENHAPKIKIDEYIILPNHFHAIINIVRANQCIRPESIIKYNAIDESKMDANIMDANIMGENIVSPLRRVSNNYNGLGKYISWFKRMTTNEYIRNVKNNHWQPFNKRLWQRNYHDHIIRNNKSLQKIRNYIHTNPLTWYTDKYYYQETQ